MIWCVEDDASIRDIEVYALQSTGLEARGFEDGTSFWEALQKQRPELVVLDVMLPGIDGIELLRRMKSSPELDSIPVVMATAKGTEYDKIQGLDLGADYYIAKPFGAIQAALKDGHSEIHAGRKGLIYQFDISRIAADGETAGVVILAFDITEKETAEQNRREFTANVSHELKTPLQGIIGSAELIENGMVKPEDMSRFVGHIRLEAQRLVTLIGDIIRLSQLDEGGDMPRENVDLLSVASAVADDLLPSADGQGISIAVEGSPANVYGVKRLLYEIVYNLCDNAIKYNRQGGSVKISTVSEGGFASVTVSDTGIGIAPEYQNRIFERFFRVDKSHSKSSGGTGLGLSIVKHAVQYHHGKIELTSAPGNGTSITVSFPAIQ